MNLKKAFAALTGILLCLLSSGQGVGGYRPGDTIGKELLQKVTAYGAEGTKLYLLDFVNPGCGSSAKAIPGLMQLQKGLGEEVRVIHVTQRSEQELQGIFKARPALAGLAPVVAGDTVLNKAFGHITEPHEVWVDRNGVIRAITGAEWVNERNVQCVLRGEQVAFAVKEERPYDYSQSLFKTGASGNRYYSIVTGYRQGAIADVHVIKDSIRGIRKVTLMNLGLLQMYQMAFGSFLYYPPTMIVWKVRDTGGYVYNATRLYRDEWELKNAYCYEQCLPLHTGTRAANKKIQEDLNAFFGLDVQMKDTMVECLVLKAIPGAVERLKSKGVGRVNTLRSNDAVKVLRNQRLSQLVWQLNDTWFAKPVVDETGIAGTVDMELAVERFDNIPALNAALERYGLRLEPAKRMQRMMVFSETN